MSEQLKKYYHAKAKKPQLYDYDNDGNLVELNKEGTVIKTIALPEYRAPTFEEYDEMEKEREQAIAKASKEFADSYRMLHKALAQKTRLPDSEILRANRKVMEADIKLQAVRFPLRFIEQENGIEIRKLDFTQPNEKRKFPYDIAFLRTFPFTLQNQYVRVGKVAPKPLVSVAEAKAMEDNSIPVILFAEPQTNDYGFLSLLWTVEIEFNSTVYNSVQQALYAEIAKRFNDRDNLAKIMIAETPEAIDYSLEDVPGDKDANESRWNTFTKQLLYDINLAKFTQYPELSERLLQTKSAQLGAYLPDDNLIGIGISLDNIQSRNPVNWTGQNLLGKVLMDIRNKLRTNREIQATTTATAATSAVATNATPKRTIRRRPKAGPMQTPSTVPFATPS